MYRSETVKHTTVSNYQKIILFLFCSYIIYLYLCKKNSNV